MEESATRKCAMLNHFYSNKLALPTLRDISSKETFIDCFLLLYDECVRSSTNGSSSVDRDAIKFVTKYNRAAEAIRDIWINKDDFDVQHIIGRGHFGEVQVVKEKNTNNYYAMKVLKKSETLSQDEICFFSEERDIMAKAKNDWLTQLQYAFHDDYFLYLVMDFHPGGDLLSLLSRCQGSRLDENESRFYLAECVLAIHSLHVMGYVHRDIKPDNILLDSSGHVKLADFGSAALLAEDKTVISKMPVGTPDYIAPEVLSSLEYGGTYGVECDWWSLGVMAYEMLFGQTPFTGDSIISTYGRIMGHKDTFSFPPHIQISDNAKSLLQDLLCDHSKRLGYTGLGCHLFFDGINWTCLRSTAPPHIPELNGCGDVAYFDTFDDASDVAADFQSDVKTLYKQLPFAGFTYVKNLSDAQVLNSGSDSNGQNSIRDLEKRYASKSEELKGAMSKCNDLQLKNNNLNSTIVELKAIIDDKNEEICMLQNANGKLQKDYALNKTEVKGLKRRLTLGLSDSNMPDGKKLLAEVEEANQREEVLMQKNKRIHKLEETKLRMECDREAATKKIERLERELQSQRLLIEESKQRITEYQARCTKVSEDAMVSRDELQSQLKKVNADFQSRLEDYQAKLSKANESNSEATELLQNLRKTKTLLQEEIDELKKRLDESKVNTQLEELEKENIALVNEVSEMQQVIAHGDTEFRLNQMLKKKTTQCQKLLSEVEDLEQRLSTTERAQKRAERSNRKLEDKIKENKEDYDHQMKLWTRDKRKFEVYRITKNDDMTNLSNENVKLKNESANLIETINALKDENFELQRKKFSISSSYRANVDEDVFHKLKIEKENLQRQLTDVSNLLKIEKQRTATFTSQVAELEKELHDVNENSDSRVSELKEKLSEAEITAAKDADLLIAIKENERKLKCRVDELQALLKANSDKPHATKNDDKLIQELRFQLNETAQQLAKVREEYDNQKRDLSQLKGDCNRYRRDGDRLREQLAEKQSNIDNQELTVITLKKTCKILEGQIQDLEYINEELETKESNWNKLRAEFENNVEEAERMAAVTNSNLEAERQSRLYYENRATELENLKNDAFSKHSKDMERCYQQLEDYKKESASVDNDMSALERKQIEIELENKSLRQQFEHQVKLSRKTEKELRKIQNELVTAKKRNFILNQDVESANEAKELRFVRIAELESQLELMQNMHKEEKMKLESTTMQQSKLIDYIQSSGTQKKKKLLGKNFNNSASKEVQEALDKEKANNIQLKSRITRLRSELEASRLESSRLRKKLSEILEGGLNSSTNISLEDTLEISTNDELKDKNRTSKERIHHNIPHRLTNCLTMRPTTCSVCLLSIHFGRQVSKCIDCQTICHIKCSSVLPHDCGLPPDLVERLNVDTTTPDPDSKQSIKQQQSLLCIAGYKLQGWMKLKKSGNLKKAWEKRWIVLTEDRIALYNKEKDDKPFDEFSLIAKNAETVINAEVNAVEFDGITTNDRPLIISIEIRPTSTCWPSRTMYLLASNFTEKQRWVKALKYLVSDQDSNSQPPFDGNVLLELNGKHAKDVNCVLSVKDNDLLVGCEEGLYTLHLTYPSHGRQSSRLNQLSGVPSVFQMQYIEDQQIVILITGKDKQLCWINMQDLSKKAGAFPQMKLTLNTIQDVHSCHLFSATMVGGTLFLCAALSNKVLLFEYNKQSKAFNTKKEMVTREPCSCIQFTGSGVIMGTDRYQIINLTTNKVKDLLDKEDATLSFAIYGASSARSFPIACVQVANDEYLLCFSEFGVFVNESGKRTRNDDLKWSRLPLSFGFAAPFLYISHFNSMEIIEIGSDNSALSRNHVNLSSPRYLGSTLTSGCIYVSSVQNGCMKIIAMQGRGSRSYSLSAKRIPLNEGADNIQISTRTQTKSNTNSIKKKQRCQTENTEAVAKSDLQSQV